MIIISLLFVAFAHADYTEPPPPRPHFGTPKTLVQAIRNGIESSLIQYGKLDEFEIERHAVDFIAQKVSIMSMRNQESADLLIKTYNLIRNNERRCRLLGAIDEGVVE